MSFRTNLNQLVFNFHTKLDAWDYSKEQKTDIVPVVGDYVVLVHLANNQWNVEKFFFTLVYSLLKNFLIIRY